MIRVHRPLAEKVLSVKTRKALAKRQKSANGFAPSDPKISSAWGNFLASRPKAEVAKILDDCFRFKCAYCESVAAQDIEHFRPKSRYPSFMFLWENFLRGCKNCNNFKIDTFPLMPSGDPGLIDPCIDDPLDYFVWDFVTGAIAPRPKAPYQIRASLTCDLLRLNQEPLREERSNKIRGILYLFANVVEESPVSEATSTRLREELSPTRPWLGIVRQLLRRPGRKFAPLVKAAKEKLPEFDEWVSEWL